MEILLVIIASIFAVIAVVCGIKLFDIGSDFADIIHNYGAFIGAIICIATITNFLLIDALAMIDGGQVFLVAISSLAFFILFGMLLHLLRGCILGDHKKKKSGRRRRLPIAAGSTVSSITMIDSISSLITGALIATSFILNFGTGVMVLSSWAIYQILSRVVTIKRYQDAKFSRGENIANLVATLSLSLIASIVCYIVLQHQYHFAAFAVAALIGYLGFICLYYVAVIVKKLQKR